jgi:sugar phosphate isomerase/epimerase
MPGNRAASSQICQSSNVTRKATEVDVLFNTIMLEPNRWTPDRRLSWPLIDLLEPVQIAGFSKLEIWQYHVSDLGNSEIDELRERLQTLGMQAVAVGAYPQFHHEGAEAQKYAAELNRTVEVSAALGASVFKIFPGRVASAAAEGSVREHTLTCFRQLATDVSQHGMVLTLETHGGTLCDTCDSTTRLLEELADVENLAICFQPYAEHDTDATISYFDAIAHRVHHLHLQNRRGAERTSVCLADGDWVDYRRLLHHVRDSGFEGISCLEFTAGIVPPEGQVFALDEVIGNAITDRRFVEATWSG